MDCWVVTLFTLTQPQIPIIVFSSFDFDSVDFTLGTPMFQTACHDSEHRYPKLYLEI